MWLESTSIYAYFSFDEHFMQLLFEYWLGHNVVDVHLLSGQSEKVRALIGRDQADVGHLRVLFCGFRGFMLLALLLLNAAIG